MSRACATSSPVWVSRRGMPQRRPARILGEPDPQRLSRGRRLRGRPLHGVSSRSTRPTRTRCAPERSASGAAFTATCASRVSSAGSTWRISGRSATRSIRAKTPEAVARRARGWLRGQDPERDERGSRELDVQQQSGRLAEFIGYRPSAIGIVVAKAESREPKPEAAKSTREVFGHPALHGDPLAGLRMVELDPPCMQKMAALGDGIAPVERVAEHGMTDRGEMRADLMHDSGWKLHFEERRIRATAARPKTG